MKQIHSIRQKDLSELEDNGKFISALEAKLSGQEEKQSESKLQSVLKQQLNEARKEKVTLRERSVELTRNIDSIEDELIRKCSTMKSVHEKFSSELKVAKKIISAVQAKLAGVQQIQSEVKLQCVLRQQINEARQEKATLEERSNELACLADTIEGELIRQCADIESELKKLSSELEAKEKIVSDLAAKLSGLEEINIVQKQQVHEVSEEDSEIGTEKSVLKNQLDTARHETTTLEEKIEELSQKLGKLNTILKSFIKRLRSMREKFSFKLEETGKIISDLDAKLLGLEDNQSERKNKFEGIKVEHLYSKDRDEVKEKKKIISHIEEKLSCLEKEESELKIHGMDDIRDRSPYSGDKIGQKVRWSRKKLRGPLQGKKFKHVRGLIFHRDKLLVCDLENSIVYILNQDYTCEKMLGSFSHSFPKPFQPRSIAVSQDKLYFILDVGNLQIIVCDHHDNIINKIMLPTDSDPRRIALVNGFVLITDVKYHRVLKYSQGGQYIAEVGGKGVGQTQFNNPFFVAVNSRDVIMVSDCDNHCIKCFDTEFNYLYQFSQYNNGQLFRPRSIAIDCEDNVYVCDAGNKRIVQCRSDGTWIRNHFEWVVDRPWYIAVANDCDRVAASGYQPNEITVFSQ
ncbi:putative leucine-rich repeat-containing protein DDB_G0290503 [Ptychodera flava]|uniref:putative leucine-rich repeat-containing protein DDB_G0290503 n=1 Tax=Ptychodera flava TaxID=63121 RepID=UPI003969EED5